MAKKTLARIISSVILLASVLFMPFWLSVILALGMMFYFPNFYEAVAMFLLSDLIYGVPEPRFFNIEFVSAILALASLLLIEIVKKKLKFYPK